MRATHNKWLRSAVALTFASYFSFTNGQAPSSGGASETEKSTHPFFPTTPRVRYLDGIKPDDVNPDAPNLFDMEFQSTDRIGMLNTLTTRYFVTKSDAIGILQMGRPQICNENAIICDSVADSVFRTFSGTCNNLENPRWGSAFSAFTRVLPASYFDGVSTLVYPEVVPQDPYRIPNSRVISSAYSLAAKNNPDLNAVDPQITNMVPQFGQFLDHDLTLTPKIDQVCCKFGHWCGIPNIEVPWNDYFYNSTVPIQNCLDFARSTPFCFPTESGVREQFNFLSAYLDASQVYGSTATRANQLREFSNGRLRTHRNTSNLLPLISDVEAIFGISLQPSSPYGTPGTGNGKYFAGDDRVNQNPALTTMHILFMREHNRLADAIRKIRPNFSDEEIFQNARRILIAEWQNIIYAQWLPIILGPTIMTDYKLKLSTTFSNYNAFVEPTIINSFAAAAFRFGHTLVNGLVNVVKGIQVVGSYLLRENFFDSEQIEKEFGYTNLLGGLMTQNSQAFDPYVVEDLTNFLLKDKASNFGSDLIARNIERGRDHGLPSYHEYRQFCGLDGLTEDWADRPSEINEELWQQLQDVRYYTPQKIDLYIGALSEDKVAGGVTGPTFSCLIAMQFQRVKDGDRYFFTHRSQAGSMTMDQLTQIKRRTLGDIICENSDINSTTLNVFKTPSSTNPWKACTDSTRPKINVAGFS